jgi:hypothetical protein
MVGVNASLVYGQREWLFMGVAFMGVVFGCGLHL